MYYSTIIHLYDETIEQTRNKMKTKKYVESIDYSRYQDRGYMGLANLGNTCFLNSCLQVLNHLYELNEIFLVKKYHKKYEKVKRDRKIEIQFVNEWTELQEILWSDNKGAVSPNKFVHFVQHLAKVKGCELFTGWAQNDLPEFLLFIMDIMHNTISRPVKMQIVGNEKNNTDKTAIECYKMLQPIYEKEYSEILDLCYGIYVSSIHPIQDNVHNLESSLLSTIHSTKSEMFFILDLPIPPRTNQSPTIQLYDCFDLFIEPEMLEGDNAWYNEETKQKETVIKRMQFWNFPDILVVMLKRFSGHGLNKRQDLIEFPIEDLNLSKYICGYNSNSYVYDLFGVCNHMGGVMGGHYHCHAKNSTGEWLHYNDTQCVKVDDPRSMITPYAYCLFYRKRTTSL